MAPNRRKTVRVISQDLNTCHPIDAILEAGETARAENTRTILEPNNPTTCPRKCQLPVENTITGSLLVALTLLSKWSIFCALAPTCTTS
jgi:hypothetical protein